MPFFIVIILSFSLFVGIESMSRGVVPTTMDRERDKLAFQHDLFFMATQSFIKKNPTTTGTFSWNTLHKQLGPTITTTGVPSHWKAVVYAPSKFVICASSTANSTSGTNDEWIGLLMQRPIKDVIYVRHQSRGNLLVAGTDKTETEAKINSCP